MTKYTDLIQQFKPTKPKKLSLNIELNCADKQQHVGIKAIRKD